MIYWWYIYGWWWLLDVIYYTKRIFWHVYACLFGLYAEFMSAWPGIYGKRWSTMVHDCYTMMICLYIYMSIFDGWIIMITDGY